MKSKQEIEIRQAEKRLCTELDLAYRRQFVQRHRFADIVSLGIIDADVTKGLDHSLVFDKLAYGFDPHDMPDLIDRVDHRTVDIVDVDIDNERTVDLEIVDRKVLQI